MLTARLRGLAGRALRPAAARLSALGLTPNAITVIGTAGTVLSAVALYPLQHYLLGTLAVTFFVLFDMLDGALARWQESSSRWGAFLDSTLDRIADGAVFASLAAAAFVRGEELTGALALVSLVCALTISYARARGEAVGGDGTGGLMERPERLVLLLVAAGSVGFGAPYGVLTAALAVLSVGTAITVLQRIRSVYVSLREETE